MPSGIHLWSQTAGSNATADSSINWAEGQAPSSVNDSARQMMARTADYLKDLGGLTTTGSSTAYAVTSNRAFASAAVMDGQIIVIRPHTTSGASPTLAVDGLTARAINYSTGVAIPEGALRSGTPVALIYVDASTEFILLGALATTPATPIGSLVDFAGSSAPAGWLLCYGQAVSRSTYAALFAAISTTYGVGDGSTTFNLPDCRGRVVAGKDDMGGSSANRLTNQSGGLNGDTLGATGGAETVTLDSTMMPAHTHTGTTASNGAHTHTTTITPLVQNENVDGTDIAGAQSSPSLGSHNYTSDSQGAHTHTFTSDSTGGGGAHNNVQPTIIFNKIIFAGV